MPRANLRLSDNNVRVSLTATPPDDPFAGAMTLTCENIAVEGRFSWPGTKSGLFEHIGETYTSCQCGPIQPEGYGPWSKYIPCYLILIPSR